jgi:hypothetical protein
MIRRSFNVAKQLNMREWIVIYERRPKRRQRWGNLRNRLDRVRFWVGDQMGALWAKARSQ